MRKEKREEQLNVKYVITYFMIGLQRKKSIVKTCSKECTSKLLSLKKKGQPHTFEHSEKIKQALLGKTYSKERCIAQGRGRQGKYKGSAHWNWNPNRDEVEARSEAGRALRNSLGRVMARVTGRFGGPKIKEAEELLEYTSKQLQEHLEKLFKPGMSWRNYGLGTDKWHVDHIRPIVAWPLDAHPRDVNALSNLQPLWQHENLQKGKKWEENK